MNNYGDGDGDGETTDNFQLFSHILICDMYTECVPLSLFYNASKKGVSDREVFSFQNFPTSSSKSQKQKS